MARKRHPGPPAPERGITLNANQVTTLLAGKPVERRLPVMPQWPADTDPSEHSQVPGYWLPYTRDGRMNNRFQGTLPDDCGIYAPVKAGDVRYIREPWRLSFRDDGRKDVCFRGGTLPPYPLNDPQAIAEAMAVIDRDRSLSYWLPAETVCESFARPIRVQVVSVRVERLQDITEDGARAEGCGGYTHATMGRMPGPYLFSGAWDRAHQADGLAWVDNPWVWVASLRQVLALPGAPAVPVEFSPWPPMDVIAATGDVVRFMQQALAVPGMTEPQLEAYRVLFVRLLAIQMRADGHRAEADWLERAAPDRWRAALKVTQTQAEFAGLQITTDDVLAMKREDVELEGRP